MDKRGTPVARVSYNGRVWSPEGKELLQNAFDSDTPVEDGPEGELAAAEKFRKEHYPSAGEKPIAEEPQSIGFGDDVSWTDENGQRRAGSVISVQDGTAHIVTTDEQRELGETYDLPFDQLTS